jgi:hypothetical protein
MSCAYLTVGTLQAVPELIAVFIWGLLLFRQSIRAGVCERILRHERGGVCGTSCLLDGRICISETAGMG